MKKLATKISLIFVILTIFSGCNTLKNIPANKRLLTENQVIVNGKISNDENVQLLPYQKPNSKLLGFRFRLFLNNLAIQNPDSVYKAKFIKNPEKYIRLSKLLSKKQVDRLGKSFLYFGIHNFLKKIGEQQVLFDETKSKKTVQKIENFYKNKGYFDVNANYKLDSVSNKKIKVKYNVTLKNPYFLDTIKVKIQTPKLDSLYQANKANSFLKNEQYNYANIENEKNRITENFRNNGAYYFQKTFIVPEIDTVKTNKKTILNLLINDRATKFQDSSQIEHFKLYKINKVNIFTDGTANKKSQKNVDSVSYKNFKLFSSGKLKFRPRAITDAIFVTKGNLYSDNKTNLTVQYLNNLRVFNYPSIQYTEDKTDTLNNGLIANIYLQQRQKYSFRPSFDLTRSNIQQFGVAANLTFVIRNVFHRAETLEITGRANLGSSQGLGIENPNNKFFNIQEIGADAKLIFPRILFPFETEKIIPKTMIPSTNLNVGFAKQTNIGLDKENFSLSYFYNWTPKKNTTMRLDLLGIQYVKNINISNYFNIYKSSYDVLNTIAKNNTTNSKYFNESGNLSIEDGTNAFADDVLNPNPSLFLDSKDFKTVRSIEERKNRLTQNDLIFTSSFIFSKTDKKSIEDENYYSVKTKLESAGQILSFFGKKNQDEFGNDLPKDFFGVVFSEYFKTELEYIRHFKLRGQQVFAIRAFTAIAVPYGNSKSIPFSRSYFAGGQNDIRAWEPYSLGPGKSGSLNDFNEANLKITLNAEFRFNIFSKTNGAIFVDCGNIWNVFDNVGDENSKFNGIKSFNDIAVGSGFGIRQDFNFFVVRVDIGFRTYDPALNEGKKWFRDYNFANNNFNFGINYPF